MTILEVISSGRFDSAQVYYNAINPSAAWRRIPPDWRGGQDFSGVLAACFHQNMGVMNIRVWAGGVLASSVRGEGRVIMTRATHPVDQQPCHPRERGALGESHGTPAQAALRFVLHNRDFNTRVLGVTKVEQLSEAIEALARGPLPTPAISKLDTLWANGFSLG